MAPDQSQLDLIWVGADAAIEAARIQARAMFWAAWIQGGLTVLAGLSALAGGYLAYLGAVRQSRLAEMQAAGLVAAYRFRIRMLIEEIASAARFAVGEASISLEVFQEQGGHFAVRTVRLSDIPELSNEHWKEHALLGPETVLAIHEVHTSLKDQIRFWNDVNNNDLKSDEFSSSAQILSMTPNPDGSSTAILETVVAENLSRATALNNAIIRLQAMTQ